MASLGSFLLLAAFVVCSYAAVVSVVGARRGSRRLIESGIGAFYLITAIMGVASAVMVNAFVTNDFSIKYVAHYSDSVQPLFYKITAYWGGLDGSIMFWVMLLSIFGSIAVYVNRERYRELIPYVVAIISTVQMFFLFLMVVHKNPFTTFLTPPPADGEGLNPVLQNYWMVIHPPSLYTGFVGMTIPYAFGMAALITGHLDDAWLRARAALDDVRLAVPVVRPHARDDLGVRGTGLGRLLGLGSGGERRAAPVVHGDGVPALGDGAGAAQHAARLERDARHPHVLPDHLRHVHDAVGRRAVGPRVRIEDPILARLFTIFMVSILIFSFGLVIYRLPLLRARNDLDSWMSREAAFLVNNWILLFCAFFILFATMFPTLSEAVTRRAPHASRRRSTTSGWRRSGWCCCS